MKDAPEHSTPDQAEIDQRSGRRELVVKELLCLGALSVALFLVALILPAALGPPPRAVGGPEHIQAPWPFAGIQYMLQYLPAWLGGLVIPALGLVFVALLPLVARVVPRGVYLPLFLGLLAAGGVLTVLGLSH